VNGAQTRAIVKVVSSHPYVILRCDACDQLVEPSSVLLARGPAHLDAGGAAPYGLAEREDSAPVGSGLLVFARGDEVRYEEPPLCARCSVAIGVTALVRWAEEEEEG
jgi:hypothetical protein